LCGIPQGKNFLQITPVAPEFFQAGWEFATKNPQAITRTKIIWPNQKESEYARDSHNEAAAARGGPGREKPQRGCALCVFFRRMWEGGFAWEWAKRMT
jgi:hypothetical protein